ncbi:succinylglutamate desuccinylase/aspartoacylase family protein [Seohaeicola nanhaiensis]|uniref:Succinylglutamate desuccinylase/aspartoacylase family protein n=1 Tax=Seohaeicola nanhaiensis TaxID=1387282 RepID=A0ABV9KH48_9RHOB
MSFDKSMIGTDIDFDREGVQFGTLRLPHSVHRSAYGHIAIPIAVVAKGSGPTVLLTGGVHGDEYEGPVALARLAREIDPDQVRGRIIIVPTMNHPAFVAGTRTSPIDGINLNRTFPGKRDGTATEMIAHYITTELLPRADCLIDLHAGGSSLQYLPTLLAPRWSAGQGSAHRGPGRGLRGGKRDLLRFDPRPERGGSGDRQFCRSERGRFPDW